MIRIFVPNESCNRVALTPSIVSKLCKIGFAVSVQKEAGNQAFFSDQDFSEAGASIVGSPSKDTDVVVCVNQLPPSQWESFPTGVCVIGDLGSRKEGYTVPIEAQEKKATLCALEALPRITRAQSMDILSSQNNLAGYRAVLEGFYRLRKICPMMMTAAGSIAPAKVLIMGAGVAGLQAIATARRLGAQVYAFDVRAAAKEQVESLGATFIDISGDGEDAKGYAREMDDDYKKQQEKALHQYLPSIDLVITTALIPGKKAPILLSDSLLNSMKKGAVVIDLAVDSGGNCQQSVAAKDVVYKGVSICGDSFLADRVPTDASQLYARNIQAFLEYISKEGTLELSRGDDIIDAVCILRHGEV